MLIYEALTVELPRADALPLMTPPPLVGVTLCVAVSMFAPKLADVENVTVLVGEDVPVDDEELNIEALERGDAVTENVDTVDVVGTNELDTSADDVKTLVRVTVPETVEETDAQILAVNERFVEADAD